MGRPFTSLVGGNRGFVPEAGAARLGGLRSHEGGSEKVVAGGVRETGGSERPTRTTTTTSKGVRGGDDDNEHGQRPSRHWFRTCEMMRIWAFRGTSQFRQLIFRPSNRRRSGEPKFLLLATV